MKYDDTRADANAAAWRFLATNCLNLNNSQNGSIQQNRAVTKTGYHFMSTTFCRD